MEIKEKKHNGRAQCSKGKIRREMQWWMKRNKAVYTTASVAYVGQGR